MNKKRLLMLIKTHIIIGIIGIVYAVACMKTGYGIPCIFRLVTGFKCPGCGISRMCLELLKLNIKEAVHYNMGVVAMSPILIYLYIKTCINYVKNGDKMLNKTDNVIAIVIGIFVIVWTVFRNVYQM